MNNINMSKKEYAVMVEQYSPGSKVVQNCLRAFLVGGLICLAGQVMMNALTAREFSMEDAGLIVACVLVVCAVFFTATGHYSKLGKFAGCGSIVPITGFANSITAPAIEYKKEGLVLGVGAKMFVIAGPVIVYGTMASVLVGLFHYLFGGR
jgi:stage V sporulation protein AC